MGRDAVRQYDKYVQSNKLMFNFLFGLIFWNNRVLNKKFGLKSFQT